MRLTLRAQATYRRLFAWGQDRYGQMGTGGRATVVGEASVTFSCEPTQVTGLNWPTLQPLGARPPAPAPPRVRR